MDKIITVETEEIYEIDNVEKPMLTARDIFANIFPHMCEKYILWLKQLGVSPFNKNTKKLCSSIDNTHHCFKITPKNNIAMIIDMDYYLPIGGFHNNINTTNPYKYKNKLITIDFRAVPGEELSNDDITQELFCVISSFDRIYSPSFINEIIICGDEITIYDIEDTKEYVKHLLDDNIKYAPLTPLPDFEFIAFKFTPNGIEYIGPNNRYIQTNHYIPVK